MNRNIYEPEIDPLDDTHPSLSVRPAGFDRRARGRMPLWRQAVGFLSLIGAAGFTLATVLVLLTPMPEATRPTPILETSAAQAATPTDMPTQTSVPTLPEATSIAQQPTAEGAVPLLPTLDPQAAALLLATPAGPRDAIMSMRIERSRIDPFTIIPDRPRNEVIQYAAQRGDTIYTIAERFGLEPESIAWSNDRRIVQVLREGDQVNIPPVNGVLITAVGTERSIAAIAAQYGIDDPFVVIESEFNRLRGLSPESVPPSGTQIFIPGGRGEEISWRPAVEREEGGGGASGGGFITFAAGEAGSCGRVANPGGGGAWVRPVDNYTVTRGYSGFHTGIDLSGAVGAPVKAANGGRVIFAGWNSFGYGYTIVLAHGPFTTLYGHLSEIYVRCGQDVAPGTVIGGVGNTGNSSGPHLHFEIRYNDIPQDPAFTIPF